MYLIKSFIEKVFLNSALLKFHITHVILVIYVFSYLSFIISNRRLDQAVEPAWRSGEKLKLKKYIKNLEK